MSKKFNCGLLRMARQARGMSQYDLSRASGLSQAQISKLESDFKEPSPDALTQIAKTLDYPENLFYAPDSIVGLPISVQYRKKASVSQKARHKLEAEINLRLLQVRRLLRAVELDTNLSLPEFDPDDFNGPEGVASILRRTWHMASGPVPNLTDLMERAGCIVISCDLSDLAVDGFTANVPGTPPCVFVNEKQPADRLRFTLAHELGHIIMHPIPVPDMEAEANNFASAFLLPPDEVRPMLTGKLTLRKLAQQKMKWKMSMGSLLMAAKSSGAITGNQSRYLWIQMSKHGYKRREPQELDFPPEKPNVLISILKLHLNELDYDKGELAELLYLYNHELVKLYPEVDSGNSESILKLVQ